MIKENNGTVLDTWHRHTVNQQYLAAIKFGGFTTF